MKRLDFTSTSAEKNTCSISRAVAQSKYATAFRKILAKGPAAERAFCSVVKSVAKQEMGTFLSKNKEFPQFTGRKSLEDFSWEKVIPGLDGSLPVLSASLRGSMPSQK